MTGPVPPAGGVTRGLDGSIGGSVARGLDGSSDGVDRVGGAGGVDGVALDYDGPTLPQADPFGSDDAEDYGGPTLAHDGPHGRGAAGNGGAPTGDGPVRCPSCEGPVGTRDRYCERCGCDLRASAGASASASASASVGASVGVGVGVGESDRAVVWRSTSADVTPCPACGETGITADGQCERCGRSRTSDSDRTVLDLPGVAGVTDRGLLRGRNEDALAIGRLDAPTGGVTVAVVCDGVSSSPRGDTAARTAVDAAMAVLLDCLGRGYPARRATEAATAAAAGAVAELPGARSLAVPPSCTYVSVIVATDEVTVGWVGDSRAYWLGPDEARALTVDDSPAAVLAATGVAVPGVDPQSVALIRWLGADAPDTRPHVVALTPAGPGRLLICSDGLSRYVKDPADLAVMAGLYGSPADAARVLTEFAIGGGGRDNITVAVLPFPPSPPSRQEAAP